MAIQPELNLRLPNSPGALSGVCRLLAAERVNILALALDAAGHLRLVVDNHVHGLAVLREQHHQVSQRDVILVSVPNASGGAGPTLGLLADANVNVEYAYGSAADGATATLVVGVDDAQRAAAAAGV